ncbi:MAG TPA: 3-deoxy-manno-octulosonate cytidylyltransferase [Candidatus Onthousia faecigallinarum]|nr:3-deoxy-manno-octulosonate cytidylyltransferase [Candidatus Onthousia faecigallinarum]
MKVVAVIPARYHSSRFPGKPLALIETEPMIAWVYGQVKQVKEIDEVVVATDNLEIKKVCQEKGMQVILTKEDHPTSTERVQEVSDFIDADLYLVVNGDEPLIDPKMIAKIIPKALPASDKVFVANLMTKIKDPVEAVDFTNIKVVTDRFSNAMFFSRSPIPYPKGSMDYDYYKHVGVLIYNKKALDFFANTPKGSCERIEDVNEIRFLENGEKIKMIPVESKSLSVDTPKDLEHIRRIVKENHLSCYH